MNIYAKEGDKVRFSFPNNGRSHQQEQAHRYLKLGEAYTVRKTEQGSWRSNVWLKEFPAVPFNTVLFDDITTTS